MKRMGVVLLSSSRILPLLRLLIVVVAVGILVLGAALIRSVLTNNADSTPVTATQRAVVAAEEAVKVNPNDGTARIKLAAAYLEEGSPSQAIAQARIAIRLLPSDPSPYYVLGLAETKTGQSDQAIADLKKASTMKGQLAPFYQDAWAALSDAQAAKGDLNSAITSMEHAISNGSDNAPLLIKQGALYEKINDYYDAAVDYAWALSFLPGQTDATAGLDRIKAAHPADYNKAIVQVNAVNAANAPVGKRSTVPTAP